jgi:hypothetical protein
MKRIHHGIVKLALSETFIKWENSSVSKAGAAAKQSLWPVFAVGTPSGS